TANCPPHSGRCQTVPSPPIVHCLTATRRVASAPMLHVRAPTVCPDVTVRSMKRPFRTNALSRTHSVPKEVKWKSNLHRYRVAPKWIIGTGGVARPCHTYEMKVL